MIEERRWGTNPLVETRAIANELADRVNIPTHIIEVLNENDEGMTAKEIAMKMKEKGYLSTGERQAVAPRITEMLQSGVLKVLGVKVCEYSKRTVGAFSLDEKWEEQNVQIKEKE